MLPASYRQMQVEKLRHLAAANRARSKPIRFYGRNLEFLQLHGHERILAGPSETGKTLACLWLLNDLAWRWSGLQAAIVRESYASMPGTVLETFENKILPFRPTDRLSQVVAFGGKKPERYIYPNGSTIWVGGMDNPDRVLSSERDIIFVNQAEELDLDEWETLSTRTTGRAGNMPGAFLMGDCNPSSQYHWIIERARAGRLIKVDSRHEDNPRLYDQASGELTPEGHVSMSVLQTLTGTRRQRLLDGLWVQAEGIVYSEFSEDNVTDAEPDLEKPIELAVDDGYVDPRAILFVQRTGTEILVFDEIYHSRHLPEVCVGEVVDRCEANKWPIPEIAVGSPEAVELKERFRKADIPYRKMVHPVVEGIQAVRSLICDGNKYRTLKIHRRCSNLLSEITEGYRYPETGTRRDDEKPVDGNDHACDALRYWVYMRARR